MKPIEILIELVFGSLDSAPITKPLIVWAVSVSLLYSSADSLCKVVVLSTMPGFRTTSSPSFSKSLAVVIVKGAVICPKKLMVRVAAFSSAFAILSVTLTISEALK